jgi:Gpi18-like mannosyltransferase
LTFRTLREAYGSRRFRTTLGTFALSRFVVFAIAEIAAVFVGERGVRHAATFHEASLAVWTRWDGVHYLAIAAGGYRGTDLAFFPLYPLAIRIASGVVRDPVVAAIVISNVSLLVALVYLRRLTAETFDDSVAARTVFYTATFPTAVVFSAAYTESLFLALSVASFFYLRRHNWLLAGFLGGLAALTRIEGVLLVVPFALEAFAHGRKARGAATIGAAMIVGGLATFMLLSALLSGDPLFFAHAQSHWQRHPAWPWASVARSFHAIVASSDAPTRTVQTIELAFTSLAIALVVYGSRILPRSFTAYAACSLIVPLLTGSLMSTQRFVLALFPAFVVLGVLGRKPEVDLVVRAISLPFLGAFTLLFAAGYWIG